MAHIVLLLLKKRTDVRLRISFCSGILLSFKGKKIFQTEEDVEGEPTVVFKVFEEFDGAIDTYYIVPDGESWLRVVSVDPDTDEWTTAFHLKMLVDRENGPLNVTYGDTITFSQGEMKAVFRRG
jgi:hypothetical protein